MAKEISARDMDFSELSAVIDALYDFSKINVSPAQSHIEIDEETGKPMLIS
jgi:hypothetical protein